MLAKPQTYCSISYTVLVHVIPIKIHNIYMFMYMYRCVVFKHCLILCFSDTNMSVESPPTTLENPTPDTPGREGFYLLKKDSERRSNLVKVINEDRQKVCGALEHTFRFDLCMCMYV